MPCKVTVSGKEYKADHSPVAGGGLATDGIKPTVVGPSHDGDVRESAVVGCLAINIAFSLIASIPFVIGLETNNGVATLCYEIKEKHFPHVNHLSPLTSDFEAMPIPFFY